MSYTQGKSQTQLAEPSFDGPSFVKEWEKQNPDTSVLYLSGYIDESLGQHSIPEAEILAKPFGPSELLREVAQRLTR